jgi:hypothetical protein
MALNTDRLSGRALPTDTYWIRVDDPTQAGEALTEARDTLRTRIMVDAPEDAITEAREAVKAAEAALKACYEPIVLTALTADNFEKLVGEHKPRPDHIDDDAWNQSTFPRACFLACAPTEWDTAGWEAFLATLTAAEQESLFMTAVRVNARVLDPTLPKDWNGILD